MALFWTGFPITPWIQHFQALLTPRGCPCCHARFHCHSHCTRGRANKRAPTRRIKRRAGDIATSLSACLPAATARCVSTSRESRSSTAAGPRHRGPPLHVQRRGDQERRCGELLRAVCRGRFIAIASATPTLTLPQIGGVRYECSSRRSIA